MLEGSVLITGGAGFLGRAIIKRATEERWPVRFTVMSRDDAKHAALQKRWPEVAAILGDVGLMPVNEMTLLFRGFDTVIHAAASKYVDRSEHAAWDTFQTNSVGSLNVAKAAIAARVPRVVGISTDKAVSPLNNYGATKFVMERLFQEADRMSEQTTFTVCRYGNVVASTGSVLQIFMGLVAEGKPIQLTDPRMTRFWMSPTEAVETVLHTVRAPGGSLVIPRCRGMAMHDVALAALGYDEHDALPEDGRVQVVGIRPGEKMHEALLHKPESLRTYEWEPGSYGVTDNPRMWRYLYVRPPDEKPNRSRAFEVTSDQPPGGGIGPSDLRAMVAEAATV